MIHFFWLWIVSISFSLNNETLVLIIVNGVLSSCDASAINCFCFLKVSSNGFIALLVKYILIKNNKNNYYIASIENNDYNLYDTTIKIADNYGETHKSKIRRGERVKDASIVLKYIEYKYIKNIYYESDNINKYYGQNRFIMYIPFLETHKYKCSCSQNTCYCKKAKYKYIAPLNIYKQNNIYIIDIITIFRLDKDRTNKYPINI